MAVAYTCPNPACGVTLKTANRVPPGKRVKCPKCERPFTPEPAEDDAPAPAVLKFADDGPKKTAPPPAPPVAPAKPPNPLLEDDDESAESIKAGYGVVKETAEELEAADKVKVKFGEVSDKFRKSARGPATALLVVPANLLTAAGLLAAVAGLFFFVTGMWPLVFNDAPPGDDEMEESIVTMLLAFTTFGWGAFICFGASQMQNLQSYLWGMAGAVMGVPLLVGIYALIVLQDPKVKAGFEETGGDPDDEDEEKDKDEEDDEAEEDDEDEDDEDEDEKPKRGAKAKRRKD